MKLVWSVTPPTVPGWYFGKSDFDEVDVVCLKAEDIHEPTPEILAKMRDANCQWAGPIPEPEEAES